MQEGKDDHLLIPSAKKESEPEVKPMKEFFGETQYWIFVGNNQYEIRCNVTMELQLVAHQIVMETLQFQLDNDKKKPKNERLKPMEKARIQQSISDIKKKISEMAAYLELQKSKPKIDIIT